MTTKWLVSLVRWSSSATIGFALAATLSGCAWFTDFREEHKGIQLETLKAAPGFKVSVYATDLPKARQMALGSGGTLFVGSNDGNVYALTISGNQVTQKRTILSGITSPSGVAFYQRTARTFADTV